MIPHSVRYVSADAAASIHALSWHEPSQTLLTTSFVEVSLVEIQRGEHQARDRAMDDCISAMAHVFLVLLCSFSFLVFFAGF